MAFMESEVKMPLKTKVVWFFSAMLVLAAGGRAEASVREGSTAPSDRLIITGTVTNPQ
ncbi:MAG: hypothetical protein GX422_19225 [Deltaproteobacteria bacterium]|jgi:hypothetical protein|nr:hypothetical protein [Deltaproteobacteria bacterium]